MNDGVQRPYFMSKGLMVRISKSSKKSVIRLWFVGICEEQQKVPKG